jgi:predicted metal-binding membrane protein
MNLFAQAANNVDAAPFVFGGGVMLVWIVFGIAALVLWLWALIDAIQNPALDPTMRIVWILVILLTNWIGAVIYLLVARSQRRIA